MYQVHLVFVENGEVGPKQADPNKEEMLMTGKSIKILGVALLFLGALVVLQPAALADTVTMTLTGVTSQGYNIGGVCERPYQIHSQRRYPVGIGTRTSHATTLRRTSVPGTHGLQTNTH